MECDVASYHVNSYNYFAEHGINLAALDVPAEKWKLHNGDCIEVSYNGATLGRPASMEDVNYCFFLLLLSFFRQSVIVL